MIVGCEMEEECAIFTLQDFLLKEVQEEIYKKRFFYFC